MMVLSWLHEKAHLPYCPNYASASAKKNPKNHTVFVYCTYICLLYFHFTHCIFYQLKNKGRKTFLYSRKIHRVQLMVLVVMIKT